MLKHNRKHNQAGFNLTELMISSAVGLIVLAGVIAIFGNTVKSNAEALKSARLNQELRAIMDVMVRDIRRAGYMGTAPCTINANVLNANTAAGTCAGNTGQANPFTAITITNLGNNADCILYNYDRGTTAGVTDGVNNLPDGVLDSSANNNENFGFQLNEDAVEMRQASAACGAGGWQDLSDPDSVTITALTFSDANSQTVTLNANNDQLQIRRIDITLSGQLASDATVRRTLTETVRIRNDRLCAGPAGCV